MHRSSYGKGKTLKHYQLASNDAGNPRAFQTLFVTPGPSCRHNQACEYGHRGDHTKCLFQWGVHINPLSPDSDQHQYSPNNIRMLPREMVMRVTKMITKEKML